MESRALSYPAMLTRSPTQCSESVGSYRKRDTWGLPLQEVPAHAEMPPILVMCRRLGTGRGICSLFPRALSSSFEEAQESAERGFLSLWEQRAPRGNLSATGVEHGPQVVLEKLHRAETVSFRVRREPGCPGRADSPGCLPSVGPKVADPEGAGEALVPL